MNHPSLLALVMVALAAGCSDTAETIVPTQPPPSLRALGWPDTTAAPYVPLDRLLRPASGRYLTEGTLARIDICPPCPPGAHCEPCPPDGFIVEALAPGGNATIRVDVPQGLPSPTTLADGTSYRLTLDADVWRRPDMTTPPEARDSLESVTFTLRGLHRLPGAPSTDRVWTPDP